MPKFQWLAGSTASVPFSGGGMQNLANNGMIGSSGIDISHSDLSLFTNFEGVFTFNNAPTLNTGITVWLLHTIDDVNWEYSQSSGNFTPARAPDFVLPLMNVTGQQRVTQTVAVPDGNYKVWAKNDGTGVSITSGDIRYQPVTIQVN